MVEVVVWRGEAARAGPRRVLDRDRRHVTAEARRERGTDIVR